jgi:hypothetical protein
MLDMPGLFSQFVSFLFSALRFKLFRLTHNGMMLMLEFFNFAFVSGQKTGARHHTQRESHHCQYPLYASHRELLS